MLGKVPWRRTLRCGCGTSLVRSLVPRHVGQRRQLDLPGHTMSAVGEHRPIQLGQRGPSVDVQAAMCCLPSLLGLSVAWWLLVPAADLDLVPVAYRAAQNGRFAHK
jgi:hypothetical protein